MPQSYERKGGGAAAAIADASASALQKANNLSDLSSKGTARSNLATLLFSATQPGGLANDQLWIDSSDNSADQPVPTGRVVTASTTLSNADGTVVFNSPTGTTLTLPAATAVTAFKRFLIKNKNLGTVTLSGTTDGTAGRTMAQYATYDLFSDGTDWNLA